MNAEAVYCFVRRDLSLQQQIVQACHACIESAARLGHSNVNHLHLVVCGVKSEQELVKSMTRVESWGIACYPFTETDLDDQLTAFATTVVPADQRALFKRFQLWRGPNLPTLAGVGLSVMKETKDE